MQSKPFTISKSQERKANKKAVKPAEPTEQQKAVSENETDKKYTLFHKNRPVINWDSLGILRQWMSTFSTSGMGTFIHYNESGREAHNQGK